jgi:two-component system NarL family sensor kinase
VKLETELFLMSDGAHPAPVPVCHPQEAASPLEALQSAALAGTMQQLIDDLPEQIALLDISGVILVANRAWKKIVQDYDYLDALPGHNYRTFCVNKAAEGYEPASHAVAAIDDIASGKRSFWQLIYNGRERWSGRDFQICMHRMEVGAQSFISVTRFDLTEIVQLRRVRDDFNESLVEGQAVERQRMARELHDSTSQLLTAVGLLLGRLKYEAPNEKSLVLVEELQDLVRETHQEIRSISYLAQPSAVEQLGLTGALKSLVEGLGRRTGLEASFEIEGDAVAIMEAAQGALYRIAQEALSNVHRHARATRVRIILSFRGLATHLVVADDGVGISPENAAGAGTAGVGLGSMRSRLSEIGGRLTLQRLSPGTAVIASVSCDGARLIGEAPLRGLGLIGQPRQHIA